MTEQSSTPDTNGTPDAGLTAKGPSGFGKPTRREILKPAELLVISAVMGLFVGLTVLLSTRQPILAIIFFGIAFIVALIVTAMFTLTFKPNAAEAQELADGGDKGTRRDTPRSLEH
ncbi:hypothetical protein [Subtercola frigoramans]|uniref:ABC transporter ATP-binding protein n=1 Tax=Subtercola frigoramans TaxID=120298 RepID=A0ABS2KZZ7_9MICO|nr:hypothetical protein [Subtercola frigoramans]MBM7470398.1 hypothetical protein [Subtercola frigoramans]